MHGADEDGLEAEGFSFRQPGPPAGNDPPRAGLATKPKDCGITLERARARTAEALCPLAAHNPLTGKHAKY